MTIKDWEKSTENLKDDFIKRFYGKHSENWWVSNEIGGLLFVNDNFYSINDILDALKYKPTRKQFFDWYNHNLEASFGKTYKINLKNFLRREEYKE